MLDIDPRQRAFRSTDGCADNTFLLDTLLRYHRKNFRSLYMASLDISKAFDSVSHSAIMETLKGVGVPSPMIEYLEDTYLKTRRPFRRVKDGDLPLYTQIEGSARGIPCLQ